MLKRTLTTTAAAAVLLSWGTIAGATASPEMTTGAVQQRVEATGGGAVRMDAPEFGEVMRIPPEPKPVYSIVPWFLHGQDYNPESPQQVSEERAEIAQYVPWYLTEVEQDRQRDAKDASPEEGHEEIKEESRD